MYHSIVQPVIVMSFFFFNDTATTEIYTLSLHDALPIWRNLSSEPHSETWSGTVAGQPTAPKKMASMPQSCAMDAIFFGAVGDRKSTRLNSSHDQISYAVFCL